MFGNFKQFTLQTIGKAEKTQESAEFNEALKVMKETKTELTAIYDAAKKYHSKQQDAADCLEKFSGSLSKFTSTDTAGRENLLAAVPMYSKSASAEQEFLNQFKINVVDVLHQIIEIQIKNAEKAYKKVEDTRLSYDAANAKFKSALENTKKSSQADIDMAKQKADESENQYNAAIEACKEAMLQVASQKDQFALSKVATLAQNLGEASAAKCTVATECLESISK